MKLLLIGGILGLIIGVALTIFYFSLATFFRVNAKALDVVQKAESANKNAAGAAVTDKKKKAHAG